MSERPAARFVAVPLIVPRRRHVFPALRSHSPYFLVSSPRLLHPGAVEVLWPHFTCTYLPGQFTTQGYSSDGVTRHHSYSLCGDGTANQPCQRGASSPAGSAACVA
ncbi:MAG: hypothetical protein ACXVCT_20115 [Ktedonobacterales bacterium]